MSTEEKMWYSFQEALDYLGINEHTIYRKMILYNLETRQLPGLKGEYLSKRDVETIYRGMHPTKL